MLIEHIEGRTVEALARCIAQHMLRPFQVRFTPRRQQCCLLAWQAMRYLSYQRK